MKKSTKIIIAILTAAALLTLRVGISLKQANDLREYAIANNCSWVYQGTMYGDDRDYICK